MFLTARSSPGFVPFTLQATTIATTRPPVGFVMCTSALRRTRAWRAGNPGRMRTKCLFAGLLLVSVLTACSSADSGVPADEGSTAASDGNLPSAVSSPAATTSLAPQGTAGTTAVLVGAGDIASCDSTGDSRTTALLQRTPGTVFTLGDNAYPTGS